MPMEIEHIKPLIREARQHARGSAESAAVPDDNERMEAWGRFCNQHRLQRRLMEIDGQLVWSEWHRAWESALNSRRFESLSRAVIISTSAIDACREVAGVLAEISVLPTDDEWNSWLAVARKCATVVAAFDAQPDPRREARQIAERYFNAARADFYDDGGDERAVRGRKEVG